MQISLWLLDKRRAQRVSALDNKAMGRVPRPAAPTDVCAKPCQAAGSACRFTALVVLLLTLAGLTLRGAAAQSPATAYSASPPVPLESGDCRLDAQILNVQIENEGERVSAAVEGRFLIQNPDRVEPQTITVTIPVALPDGLMFDPERLSDFTIRTNGVARQLVALHSTPPVESQQVVTQAYALTLDVPAGGVVSLDMSYSQNLGQGDQVSFHFASSLGSRWPGAVGSSLITVKLPDPAQQEQVLSARPANVTFDAAQMTWYDSDFEPKEDLAISFVNPALWKEIQENRSVVAANPASAEAHYRLALLYQRILSVQPSAGDTSKFEPLMLAELATARKLSADRPGPLRCAIGSQLANFYSSRLTGLGDALNASSATQALQELEWARQVCPESELSPEWLSRLEYLHLYLARNARANGLYGEALAHLDRLAEPGRPLSHETDLAGERRLCYLAWIAQMLAEGDVERAMALAAQAGLVDTIAADSSLAPKFESVQAIVSTDADERRIAFIFALSPLAADSESVVRQLQQATADWVGIGSEWSGSGTRLEWSLSFPLLSYEDLLQKQAAVARALPDWIELNFVRDILIPQNMARSTSESWWDRKESYIEVIDLFPSGASWAERQKICEAGAAQYAARAADDTREEDETTLVSRIKAQLLQLYGNGWARLLHNSRAVFSVEWQPATGRTVRRVWLAPVGQVQEMKLEDWNYNLAIIPRIGAYFLTAFVALIVLAALFRVVFR